MAGEQQQHAAGDQFVGRQPVIFVPGVEQAGRHILGVAGAVFFEEAAEIGLHLDDAVRRHPVFFRIAARGQHEFRQQVRPALQMVDILHRHAEHLRDDHGRQGVGEFVDQVEFALAGPFDPVIDIVQ